MIIEIRGGDEKHLGKMAVHWEEGAALFFLRGWIVGMLRAYSDNSEPTPTQAEMQKILDELMIKADALLKEIALQVFHDALAQIVTDVWGRLMPEALRRMPSIAEMMTPESMQVFDDFQKQKSEFLKVRDNELMGVFRGRRSGQKDAKPREKRIDSADCRNRILTAMRAIGRELVYKKSVATKVGITTPTLKNWLGKIKEDFGEDWDDLTGEAFSTES